MIVFKTYLKLINKNKFQIFLFLLISMGIVIALAKSSSNQKINSFDSESYKSIDVGIVNKSDNLKNKELISLLDDTFSTNEIKDDEIAIKDALFFETVDYVLIIDGDKYENYQVPNSSTGYIVENYINNYLSTYQNYKSANNKYSEKELVNKTKENLNIGVEVKTISKQENEIVNLSKFFNLYVYGALGTIITGISTIMLSFNKKNIYERTVASSMSLTKRNIHLYISHALFGLFVWLVFSTFTIILNPDVAFSDHHKMFLVNSFVFTFCATALAFMIGQLIKKQTIISAVNNIVGLGMSFISGAFIPQALLGSVVLSVASFTPAYWYVLNNEKITEMASFNLDALMMPLLIQIGFVIAFCTIALSLSKYKLEKR
ncbi:ABC-2 type transport system permease protein [Bacilli bacterium PM5-9]|nr:ABC-2 type transport system permease protein [Bacilli bacterium PM5-9]